MSEQHHDPRNPVASAYWTAACSLDDIARQIGQASELACLAATADGLDWPASGAFCAIGELLESICAKVKAEDERFSELSRTAPAMPVAQVAA